VAGVFAEITPALTASLYRLLGNWEDAHDAAQTVFLKCWRARERLGAVRDLRGWFFRIAFNVASDLRRRGARRTAVPLESLGDTVPERSAVTAEVEALQRERLDLLRAALGELRPGEREVFVLRQEVALTYEEIAAARGQPVGTVKTLMRTALRKLCDRFADHRAG
jgi:RNA polymerase sigma-70 factor (ECF subfamily)